MFILLIFFSLFIFFSYTSLWLSHISPPFASCTTIFRGSRLCNIGWLNTEFTKMENLGLSLLRCVLWDALKIRFHISSWISGLSWKIWRSGNIVPHSRISSVGLSWAEADPSGQGLSWSFPQLLPLHNALSLLFFTHLYYPPGLSNIWVCNPWCKEKEKKIYFLQMRWNILIEAIVCDYYSWRKSLFFGIKILVSQGAC